MGAKEDEDDDSLTGIHESQLNSFVRHWNRGRTAASPAVRIVNEPPSDIDDDEPGATRVYDDRILLRGMTREELERLRREMVAGPSSAPAASDDDADDEDDAKTAFGMASAVRADQIRDRLDALDYAGALVLAERFIEAEPRNAMAELYVDRCRKLLARAYRSRLGNPTDAPRLVVGFDEIEQLDLDRMAAFLVSRIDGEMSIDELLDLVEMPPLDALRILYELVQRGVVTVEPPRRSGRP